MKWCFLINNIDLMVEFFGKLSHQIQEEGDECLLIFNSKISEYRKRKFFSSDFSPGIKTISKVDWLIKNYKEEKTDFNDVSWKEFFPTFERKSQYLKLDYSNSVKIVAQLCQFLKFVFETEKPDVVINEAPANIFTEIAYHLCKKYNIVYIGFTGSRINGRLDFYDLEHTCSNYEKTFREIKDIGISENERKFAIDFIKNFISHKQLPSYMDFQIKNIQSGKINRIKRYIKEEQQMFFLWIRYIFERKQFALFDYESRAVFKWILSRPWFSFKKRFRLLLQKSIFDRLNENDKFFLFPLHLQPESSTSVHATYFCDQLNAIKNIAFALPFPYKLYVKEHPSAVGTRTRNFYKEIKKLPNTVLVSSYEDVENLVKKSQGIVTLTSTLGMEAALAGKPTYVLGNVFYTYHPLCRKVNSFEELREKIREDLNKPIIKDLENINIRFIISYFRNTIEGDVNENIKQNDANNYKAIYQGVKKMFLKNER